MHKSAVGLVSLLACALAPLQSQATTRIQKTFDKWTVSCVEPEESVKRCSLTQSFRGKNQKTGQPVFIFSWSVSRDAGGATKAFLRAPLGVDLKSAINVQFPDLNPIAVSYLVCNRRGCFGELGLDKAWTRELERQKALLVEYRIRNGQAVKLEMDLTGFTKAHAFFNAQLEQ